VAFNDSNITAAHPAPIELPRPMGMWGVFVAAEWNERAKEALNVPTAMDDGNSG
jgi:hypothetical protein